MNENLTFLLIQNTNHISYYLTVMYNILMYHWYFFPCCNKTILFDIGKEEAILPPLLIHQTPGPPLPSSTTIHPTIQPTNQTNGFCNSKPAWSRSRFVLCTHKAGRSREGPLDRFFFIIKRSLLHNYRVYYHYDRRKMKGITDYWCRLEGYNAFKKQKKEVSEGSEVGAGNFRFVSV